MSDTYEGWKEAMIERKDRSQKKVVCCLLFILLLPSVSPLSMSQSGLPLAVIRVSVGKSVLARTLLQVGCILPLVFAPCDPPSFWSSLAGGAFSPVALLKYLPLPSRNPSTQSPSYLVMRVIKVTLVMTTLLFEGDQYR